MGPFIGIIVYCAIAYYVVPRAYEIETAKGPEADLKRLEVRGPYLGKGGATLYVLMLVFFPGWVIAKGFVWATDLIDTRLRKRL